MRCSVGKVRVKEGEGNINLTSGESRHFVSILNVEIKFEIGIIRFFFLFFLFVSFFFYSF